jgi:exosome complex RNA-binding protein Rrp42 (RNase PH superfamily)
MKLQNQQRLKEIFQKGESYILIGTLSDEVNSEGLALVIWSMVTNILMLDDSEEEEYVAHTLEQQVTEEGKITDVNFQQGGFMLSSVPELAVKVFSLEDKWYASDEEDTKDSIPVIA